MAIVGDSEFVVIWQSSRTLAEAARKSGYSTKKATTVACARARRLRARGVPLRRFRKGDSLARLRFLARRTAQDVARGLA